MEIAGDYRECIVNNEQHMEVVMNCLKCRVGNLAINHVNLVFNEPREDIAKELKEIAIDGKEFKPKEFTLWIKEVVRTAKWFDIYFMIKDEEGWGPKASIKKHPHKEEGTLKIHFKCLKSENGTKMKRCDFIQNFNISDKNFLMKVFRVLHSKDKEHAIEIWNEPWIDRSH